MKILFLHLSDIHITKKEDGINVNIDKLIQSLNTLGALDECIIIISGDIASEGRVNEYREAGGMLAYLVAKLKNTLFYGKWINILIVPGNHDLDLTNNERSFQTIMEAFKSGKEKNIIENDLKSLSNFYEFASRNQCFKDNQMVSHRKINLYGFNINFILINTTLFSLEGSTNQDMGIHYLNKDSINNLIPKTNSNLNIAVMHHSYEWFANSVKEEIKAILTSNFSIVFEGHEHDGFGEQKKVNDNHSIVCIQGNSLSGDKNHNKGFIAVVFNTEDNHVTGYSYMWNKDYYKPSKILDEIINEKKKFKTSSEFVKILEHDDNNELISKNFVFPSLSYNSLNEEKDNEIINEKDTFMLTILKNDKTIINGESKSGKTTLSKLLFQYLIDSNQNVVPILLFSEDLRDRKYDRIVENAFKDQYSEDNNAYDKFLQLDKMNRIAIIDDADKITKIALDKILDYFDTFFSRIIMFSGEKLDLNIQNQVVDALTEKKVGKINIRPFLYDKRKDLISKVYSKSRFLEEDPDPKHTIEALNNMINSQVRYFRLDPEFIVNFVTQFAGKYKLDFSPGSNIFNIVYETSIKNRIIKNVSPNEVNGLFRVMSEIAYFMHFNKKVWITIEEVSKIIEKYNNDFRQNVQLRTFLDAGQKSKLTLEKDTKIKFKDNNLLSYFIAQALNTKYHYENEIIKGNIEYLLDNLCIGINSDIVLFMALITSNPNIIGVVFERASLHFKEIKELNFDENNIPFLCQSDFCVKNSFPDNKEKKEKENQLIQYEEELKASEFVELVDEYEYDEKDIATFENQVVKSIKYLEVLSKILPAFSHNMIRAQQDMLVQAIYSYTNRFLYQWLISVNDNYDEILEEIYNKISEIRKEKNIATLHIDSVKKMLEDASISLVLNLYQLVSSTATTGQTMNALNDFDFKSNSNYSILNLMMVEKTTRLKEFYEKASKLYDNSKIKLIKSMVKFSVRNYFLNHDVNLVGEAQSLLDKFFGESKLENVQKKKIVMEISRKQIKRS